MIKTGFSYLKLMAVVAVLAMTLIPSMRTSTAKNQLSPMVNVPGTDLANEERVITRYSDDLINYEVDVQRQAKRAALVSADIDPLQRRSDNLKGRLSEVQNALRDVVRKLKAANEWDRLDATVEANTKPETRAYIEHDSLKRLLEDSASNLNANEISAPLDNLRKRLTSRYGAGSEAQIVRAAYAAPAAFESGSLGCRIGRIGERITIAIGGTISKERAERVFNRCHPDGTINPF
jgi:hypothetical protein